MSKKMTFQKKSIVTGNLQKRAVTIKLETECGKIKLRGAKNRFWSLLVGQAVKANVEDKNPGSSLLKNVINLE